MRQVGEGGGAGGCRMMKWESGETQIRDCGQGIKGKNLENGAWRRSGNKVVNVIMVGTLRSNRGEI